MSRVRRLFMMGLGASLGATPVAAHSGGAQFELVAAEPRLGELSELRYEASGNRLIGATGPDLIGISLDSGTIDAIGRLDSGIAAFALDGDSKAAAVATGESSVVLVDLARGRVIGEFSAGTGNPDSIVYDASAESFVVGSRTTSILSLLSTDGETRKSMTLRGPVSAMAANGRGWLFATAAGRPAVYIVDTEDGVSLGEFPLPGCVGAGFPAVDDAERRLYVTCENGWLLALDSDTGVLLSRMSIPPSVSGAVLVGTADRNIEIVIGTRNNGLWLATGRITATAAENLGTELEGVRGLAAGLHDAVFVIHGQSVSRMAWK